MSDNLLSYEKLDVYKCALEFFAMAHAITESIPKGNAVLVDQFRRSSLSVVLNIAEASGKPTSAEKSRFFGIARGSVMECGAMVEILWKLDFITGNVMEKTKAIIVRIASMLSKMCR